jgi:hypothetical protein
MVVRPRLVVLLVIIVTLVYPLPEVTEISIMSSPIESAQDQDQDLEVVRLVEEVEEGLEELETHKRTEKWQGLEELETHKRTEKWQGLSAKTGLTIALINHIYTLCAEKEIPPELLLALIETESDFDPNAVNERSGATGLGQFLPSTAEWIASINDLPYSYDLLKDPYYNVELMILYLDHLYKREQDWRTVLSLYVGHGYRGRYSRYTETVLSRSKSY